MTTFNPPAFPPPKPRPRLACFEYVGAYRYFVTICTYGKVPLFTSVWPYVDLVAVLSAVAGKYGFDVLAYTFMPDHLHLLVEGAEKSDLKEFVRAFKSKTAYYWKRHPGGILWQASYYDRVLRRDEASLTVARYILNNPVRRRFAPTVSEYPFSGSFVCRLEEISG
jgi:putative transposase